MEQRPTRIVRDAETLDGEPRIEGRRISVRQIAEWVEESDRTARTVADCHNLDIADVYAALAYYHSHAEEMDTVDRHLREREQAARAEGAVSLSERRDGE